MASYFRMAIYFNFVSYALCTSLRNYLVWELYAGGLAGHFGRQKTSKAVESGEFIYWPSLRKDVVKLIG